jgi:diguanylate cyclase (GGDEF)-like protein/PAS domain S-box-containing protein
VLAPVIVGSQLLGVAGLQVLGRPRPWDGALVGHVEVFAGLLVQAVVRTRQRGALEAANVRARRIAESIPDGIVLLATDGTISWVSPSFVRMSGMPAKRLLGARAVDLFHPSDRAQLDEHLASASDARETLVSAQLRGIDGEWRWTEVALRLASDPGSGVPDEIVMGVRDTHERHLRELQLARQSELDVLTGLLNRAGLDRAVAQLASGTEVSVAFCDVDDFKLVNDELGHDAGDALLRAVAQALRDAVRDDDLVARIGGDEFAVVVTGAGEDDAERLGERLVRAIGAVGDAFGGVSVSVGVCGPGPACDVSAMRRDADLAMYSAKRGGKDGWVCVGWGSAQRSA